MNSIKRYSYFLVLTISLLQIMIHPLLYLEFQIRRDFIVENICLEREYKINLCQGKCQIIKIFDASAQQEKEQKEKEVKPLNLNLYLFMVSVFSSKLESQLKSLNSAFPFDSYSSLNQTSIFKPPIV